MITCIQKIFNTIIRKEWICDKLENIPGTQNGIRKGRGCSDYLLNFIIDVYSALSFKESIMVGSLDLSNAYIRVLIPTLVNKMVRYGIPIKYIRYCHQFLTNRTLTLSTNKSLITRLTIRGFPQGSVLSPILFSLYIAHINGILPQQLLSLQYVDDVIIYTSHKGDNINKTNMEHVLRMLENKFRKIHMEINGNTSKLICFSSKNKINLTIM